MQIAKKITPEGIYFLSARLLRGLFVFFLYIWMKSDLGVLRMRCLTVKARFGKNNLSLRDGVTSGSAHFAEFFFFFFFLKLQRGSILVIIQNTG